MQSSPSSPPNDQEENSHDVGSFDLEAMPQPQLNGHAWRQRGTELICESCPFTHSSYIPPHLQLYGIDENGYPMIRQIKF